MQYAATHVTLVARNEVREITETMNNGDTGRAGSFWKQSERLLHSYTGLILGLRPANERRRYKVTPSPIG